MEHAKSDMKHMTKDLGGMLKGLVNSILGACKRVLKKLALLGIRSLKFPSKLLGFVGFYPKKTFLGIVYVL